MSKDNFNFTQWDNFTDELKDLLSFINLTLTYEHPVLTINENYFLLAIFQEKNCLAYKIIDALISSTAFNLVHDAYFRLVSKGQLITVKPNRVILFDNNFHDLISESIEEKEKLNDDLLSSIHVVLALINPDRAHNNVQKIFKGAGLTYQLLSDKLSSLKTEDNESVETKEEVSTEKKEKSKGKFKLEYEIEGFTNKPLNGQYLKNYCYNLNNKAKEGKIDKVICRDDEIQRICTIFNRRRKNNVVIVGEKGSGKTALCEYLALLIENRQAPYSLQDKIILKLDIPSLISGTTYRGMFEERIKGVFNELQKNPNCVLFIDDINAYTNKKEGESNTDITPFLKEAIDNDNIKTIVTCNPSEYHKKFDNDPSFANKFQRIDLNVLSLDKIKEIICGIKYIYEEHHLIEITDEIVDLCVKLCSKYITDREMPDSVIDLIDEIGAYCSQKYIEIPEIKTIKNELLELAQKKKNLIQKQEFDEIDNISEDEKNKLKLLKDIEKKHKHEIITITDNMVYDIISKKTGIPIQNLSEDGKKDLSNINTKLKQVIIGQDNAIDIVCKTIKRKKLGLHNGRGTAILLQGTTGCGKTLLAKKLAEELFGNENAMVRFDMSEYADKTSINKLIGASSGYVGYEEGGLLTEAIKNKKHCILLLDEIEKADDEIFNIFLQVFDEGFLTDNMGQKVDFRNVIILLTSNIGAKSALENNKTIGFTNTTFDKKNEILNKELKRRFSPEFLNRLDNIVFFNSLTKDNLKHIIKLEIDKSVNRFKDIGYNISYNDNIIEHVAKTIEGEQDYGARPIIRAVQNEIEDPLTDSILEGLNDKNLFISYNDGNFIIDVNDLEISDISE